VWELLPWSSCVRHFEGRADGRPAVAQRRAWWRLVVPYSHSVGMVLQCPGWRRGSGDGRTGLMVAEETCLTGLTSRHRPGRA
jgi:hypothetical protein